MKNNVKPRVLQDATENLSHSINHVDILLATGWMAERSNHGGVKIFHTCPD
jgi:hypothetical protein